MKYEKFIKNAGINGIVITDPDGRKWIYNDGVAMVIPSIFVDIYGDAWFKFPENIFAAIKSVDPETTDRAKLVRAEIPADGKAKEIIRIYADADFEFGVCNVDWSLIERNDKVFIAIDDNDEPAGLVIYEREQIVGVIFPIGFTMGDLEKIN